MRAQENARSLALFVFIDAYGWEIARRYPLLPGELTVAAPLGTVFGYSCTCDPTILTGRMPSEHGHFSFFVYDPARSPFTGLRWLNLLPHGITKRGRVRRLISRLVARWHGFTGYFQLYNMPFELAHLFDYTERRDLYLAGGINSGVPTIFDHLRANGIPHFRSDWRGSEEAALGALSAAIDGERPPFAYLYLAAMDALLHAEGTQSPLVAAKVAWYDERLREVLAHARRRYDEVRLYVFSDHGMTDTVQTCDLMARIGGLGLRFGTDYAAMYDSTMARFWFLRPGVRERVEAALAREPAGHVLPPETLRAWGCDFADRRYGELFFLMRPGVLLCPSFMGETRLAGMHGFDPGDPGSVAFFGSTAPVQAPPRLDGLYGLMRDEARRLEPGGDR